MSTITVKRYHDISCGHRVAGHESKCAFLHGHNYRVTFTCQADQLDSLGRVIDFSVIKAKLCMWLEDHWDHRFLVWEEDRLVRAMHDMVKNHASATSEYDRKQSHMMLTDSIVWVPFNPTAENMAEHLLLVIGPAQLAGTDVRLTAVEIEETRKCSASAAL